MVGIQPVPGSLVAKIRKLGLFEAQAYNNKNIQEHDKHFTHLYGLGRPPKGHVKPLQAVPAVPLPLPPQITKTHTDILYIYRHKPPNR